MVGSVAMEKANKSVIENLKLCAEQGWKCNFKFKNGELFDGAYITGTDWNAQVVRVERVNERTLPPRLIELVEVESVEVLWS